MRNGSPWACAAAVFALAAAGCSAFESVGLAPNRVDPTVVRNPGAREEPGRVGVRHVLIGFEGALPTATRTRDEARALAETVYERARSGADFRELVRLYTDDRHGDGSYVLVNFGIPARGDEVERARFVRGFTRAAFSLEPGQIALVAHDPDESPYGWHVIVREK
jgi:hypothetical protein